MDNNYKVYRHTSPNGKIYIGLTQQQPEQRWRHGNGYKKNIYFMRAINKYGWENFKHEVLFDGLTKEEAENIERSLIASYNSANKDYGYNIDLGGNSVGKHSDETRRKIGVSHSGEKNWTWGKCLPEETRKKMSESHKGKRFTEEHKKHLSESQSGEKHYMYGKHHSAKMRQMYSDAAHKKPVAQIDRKTNEIICIFVGVRNASRMTSISNASISECCRGKRKSAGGYIWKFIE